MNTFALIVLLREPYVFPLNVMFRHSDVPDLLRKALPPQLSRTYVYTRIGSYAHGKRWFLEILRLPYTPSAKEYIHTLLALRFCSGGRLITKKELIINNANYLALLVLVTDCEK